MKVIIKQSFVIVFGVLYFLEGARCLTSKSDVQLFSDQQIKEMHSQSKVMRPLSFVYVPNNNFENTQIQISTKNDNMHILRQSSPKKDVNDIVQSILLEYEKNGTKAKAKSNNKQKLFKKNKKGHSMIQYSNDENKTLAQEMDKDDFKEEVSSEQKLLEQIANQSKAIVTQQLNEQKKAQMNGTLKISSAAAALNKAEMGIDLSAQSGSQSNIMSVSSDQLFIGEKKEQSDQIQSKQANNEAAAITMAKQAAKIIQQQQQDEKKKELPKKQNVKINKNQNLELEQSRDLDEATIQEIESKQQLSDQGEDIKNQLEEDKSQIIELDSNQKSLAKSQSDDSLQIPKWQKYQNILSQKQDIEKELKDVTKQADSFKIQANQYKSQISVVQNDVNLSEIEKKQLLIDLKHNETISRIKNDIWLDRVNFLQKILKISNQEAQINEQSETENSKVLAQNVENQSPLSNSSNDESKLSQDQNEQQVVNNLDPKISCDEAIHNIENEIRKLKGANPNCEHQKVETHKVESVKEQTVEQSHVDLDIYEIFKDSDKKENGVICDSKITDEDWFNSRNLNKHAYLKEFLNGRHNSVSFTKYQGLTDEQWEQRQQKAQVQLKVLLEQQKHLLQTHSQIQTSIKEIGTQKQEINGQINKKLQETEQMKKEFKERALKKAEEERKLKLLREIQKKKEIEEEKLTKLKQIKETEEIEQKALELHKKEKELKKQSTEIINQRKEILDKISQLKLKESYAKKAKIAAAKLRKRILNKRAQILKKKQEKLQKLKELALKKIQHKKTLDEHCGEHQELFDNCPKSKVRISKCDEDGFKIIKYFKYHYSVESDSCIKKVKSKMVKCVGDDFKRKSDELFDYIDDEEEDNDDHVSKIQKKLSNFNKFTKHQEHSSDNEFKYDFQKPKNIVSSEEEVHHKVQEKKKPSLNHSKTVKNIKYDICKGSALCEQKLDLIISQKGKLEESQDDESQETASETQQQDIDEINKPVQQKVQIKNAPIIKQQNEITADMFAQKESSSQDNLIIDTQKYEQKLGQIQGQFSDINKKYDNLQQEIKQKDKLIEEMQQKVILALLNAQNKKDAPVRHESIAQISKEKQSKIQKFAKMLKQLMDYKSEYKSAKTDQDKQIIHQKVAKFTKKWLDSKNIQLASQIEFKSPAELLLLDKQFIEKNSDIIASEYAQLTK